MSGSKKTGSVRHGNGSKLKGFAAITLAIIMTFTAVPAVFSSDEYPVREGDYADAADGDVLMGIEGEFVTVDEAGKELLLARVNEIRYEACAEGVPSPSDRNVALTSDDYVPLKWSQLIEKVAAMRAAEASVRLEHKRLSSNESVWDDGYGASTNAENLAWNWDAPTIDAIIHGIEQWYEEKSDWVNDTGGVTGHYTSMINPKMKYIGLAGFYNSSASYYMTVTNQLSSSSGFDESVAGIGGKVTQKTRVNKTLLTDLSINGPAILNPGAVAALTDRATVSVTAGLGTSRGKGPLFTGLTWESSNENVVTVDSNGNVTAVGEGSATITAKVTGTDLTATHELTVAETVDPALKFEFASLSLSDSLAVNFLIPSAPFTGDSPVASDPFVKFTFNGGEYTVNNYKTSGNYFVFRFANIAPHMMNDNIKAELFVTPAGKAEPQLSASINYSIVQYCMKLLEVYGGDADNNLPLLKLVVDTLNYGAAAQTYMNYNTDELATSSLTSAQLAWGTTASGIVYGYNYSDYETVSSPEVEWTGGGLFLDSGITVRLKITADDTAGLVLKITDNAGLNRSISSSEFVRIGETNTYYVYFSGLNPAQLSKVIYAHFERNDQIVSNTLRFSVNNYIGELIGDTASSASLKSLLFNLYYYGESAKEYAASLG